MPDPEPWPHPLGREASDVVFGLLTRVGVPVPRGAVAARIVVAIGAALVVALEFAVVGAVAAWLDEPMVVPSIGPSVFLLVFAPTLKIARPRNVMSAHVIGTVAGVGGRVLVGLYGTGSALSGGLSATEIAASVIAVGMTALVVSLLDVPHPPAAATALIVGLGLIERPQSLTALVGGVALITVVGVGCAQVAGLRPGSDAQ